MTSLWLAAAPLVLASGSAARRDMLVAAGLPVEIVKPAIDERAVEKPLAAQGLPADRIAVALAEAKALAVSRLHRGRIVLAADQTLICGGRSFHKPENPAATAEQIAALSGRAHELHSAFVLARDGTVLASGCDTARLTMRRLDPQFVARYVEAAGPVIFSSVGGYQLEGVGAQLFERIEGDHFTILGLPLLPVLAALRDLGHLAR